MDALVAEASAAIAAGARSTFTFTQRHKLGEVHVATLPTAREWLSRRLKETFFPLLAERYGLNAEDLRVFDSLVIQYDAAREAVSQPMHRDASLLSLNVALSHATDYDGGGTFFEGLGRSLSLERGHAMCHPSGMRHAGHRITRGTRWVLVCFVIAKPVVQAPRRAAAFAWDAKNAGAPVVASSFFRAAIQLARDARAEPYEFYFGLAAVHATQGEAAQARASYLEASYHYALAPQPHLALGLLLTEAGRPRAALRRFERSLELAHDPEDSAACEARSHAARCAVRLARAYPAHAAALLPTAERRLRDALADDATSPDDRELTLALLREVEAMAVLK